MISDKKQDYEAQKQARRARLKVIEKEIQKEKLDVTGHELYFKDLKKKNQDDYGGAIIGYAELWGKIMQHEMKNNHGRLTKKIIEDADSMADTKYGLSGYMYNTAKAILATCWKYGFKLAVKTNMFATSKPNWLIDVVKGRRQTTDYKFKQAQQNAKAAQPNKKGKDGRE